MLVICCIVTNIDIFENHGYFQETKNRIEPKHKLYPVFIFTCTFVTKQSQAKSDSRLIDLNITDMA